MGDGPNPNHTTEFALRTFSLQGKRNDGAHVNHYTKRDLAASLGGRKVAFLLPVPKEKPAGPIIIPFYFPQSKAISLYGHKNTIIPKDTSKASR